MWFEDRGRLRPIHLGLVNLNPILTLQVTNTGMQGVIRLCYTKALPCILDTCTCMRILHTSTHVHVRTPTHTQPLPGDILFRTVVWVVDLNPL